MSLDLRFSLLLSDFSCEFDETSTSMGISPSKINRKGDNIGKTARKYQENHWILDSSLDSISFDEHIQAFSCYFPRIRELRKHTPQLFVQLKCVSYMRGNDTPILCLESGTVKKLAAIGASIDIDLYCLSEGD